jgi:hypothetical protein
VTKSEQGATPAAKPVERVTHAVPKTAVSAIALQDPATLAEQFRANASLFASRWAPTPAQPRAPEPEPMALDLVEKPAVSGSFSAPQAAAPRAPVAETPTLPASAASSQVAPPRTSAAEAANSPVGPCPRIPSELSLATSRWAVPDLVKGHALRDSSGAPSSPEPEQQRPREAGRLTPMAFSPSPSSNDEEMASPQPFPGRYEATAAAAAKSTLAPGFLYALSLGNAARSDSKILGMAEQFMMDD